MAHGNTPSLVGKTSVLFSLPLPSEKHPHARGEDLLFGAVMPGASETPPRSWGRPSSLAASSIILRNTPTLVGRRQPFFVLLQLRGNTPTLVGKTRRCSSSRHSIWKHPHARGEDLVESASSMGREETPPRSWGRPEMVSQLGDAEETPPRSWGRPCHACPAYCGIRNTPTLVGKTSGRSS